MNSKKRDAESRRTNLPSVPPVRSSALFGVLQDGRPADDGGRRTAHTVCGICALNAERKPLAQHSATTHTITGNHARAVAERDACEVVERPKLCHSPPTAGVAGTENMSEPKPIEAETRGGSCAPALCSADFDYYPEEYWDDEETCDMCGGDGMIEYLDHPEVWGEDCPSDQNHLLPCPECWRRDLAERRKANPPNRY